MKALELFDASHRRVMDVRLFVEGAAADGYQMILTGSRYFGSHTVHSDWDFFVQDDPNLTPWLESAGFVRPIGEGRYADYLTLEVFENRDLNIHVQVVKDAGIKQRAQEALLATDAIAQAMALIGPHSRRYDRKAMLRLLWNTAILAAGWKK